MTPLELISELESFFQDSSRHAQGYNAVTKQGTPTEDNHRAYSFCTLGKLELLTGDGDSDPFYDTRDLLDRAAEELGFTGLFPSIGANDAGWETTMRMLTRAKELAQ